MIAIVQEARAGTIGVFRMLSFQKGWQSCFNPSAGGVARSFAGIFLSLPAYIFTIYAIDFTVAESSQANDPDAGLNTIEAILTWVRYWLLFPIMAALTSLAAGLTQRYGAWLVVQNWTVFVMVHIQALLYALYVAGLADLAALAQLMSLYILLRGLAFWRVAAAALEVRATYAVALAGIPFLADFGMRALTQS